jgi:hypothetical protein
MVKVEHVVFCPCLQQMPSDPPRLGTIASKDSTLKELSALV